jgi:hypothetical protein
MQCCACGAVAQDKTPGDVDGVIIVCRRCGEYGISLSLPKCSDALANAKRFAQAGQWPIIDTRCIWG